MNDTILYTADTALALLRAQSNEVQRHVLMRFFKTGRGEYGEGDEFWGLKVPQTRAVAVQLRLMPLSQVELLLHHPTHEVRLCGLLILVEQFHRAMPSRSGRGGDAEVRDAVMELYIRNLAQCNNWDLVDLSAPKLLGEWLLTPRADGTRPDRNILDRLAVSRCMWEQRVAIVATWTLVAHGEFTDTLRIADILLSHPHDLLHKAVGWQLREVGKRDVEVLRRYLVANYARMPRTTLRYAIERLPEKERREWLQRK